MCIRDSFWLGTLCDRVVDENIPEPAVDLLGLTKLTPLLKDGGGIRPVAGGECLRKLAARALVREHKETLLKAVGEHQFGAGRPGGAEILVHAVQVVSEARPSHAWVQLGVKNAFPSIHRQAVLEAVSEGAPALLPIAETFLRRASTFVYLGSDGRGEALHATFGVEQGDVLGPLLFALAFRKPVEALREAVNGGKPLPSPALEEEVATLRQARDALAAAIWKFSNECARPAGCNLVYLWRSV